MGADIEKPEEGAVEPGAEVARIGSVVDKYTIVGLLGQGGMGAVYEARHAKLARRVAIKFLLPQFSANREILRRSRTRRRRPEALSIPTWRP